MRSENSYPSRRHLSTGNAHGRCHGFPYADVSTGRRQWWSACFGLADPRWGESDCRASGCRLLVVVSTTLTSRAPSEGPDASVSQSEAVRTGIGINALVPDRQPTGEVSLSSNDIWWDMMLEGELTLGGGPATPRRLTTGPADARSFQLAGIVLCCAVDIEGADKDRRANVILLIRLFDGIMCVA